MDGVFASENLSEVDFAVEIFGFKDYRRIVFQDFGHLQNYPSKYS